MVPPQFSIEESAWLGKFSSQWMLLQFRRPAGPMGHSVASRARFVDVVVDQFLCQFPARRWTISSPQGSANVEEHVTALRQAIICWLKNQPRHGADRAVQNWLLHLQLQMEPSSSAAAQPLWGWYGVEPPPAMPEYDPRDVLLEIWEQTWPWAVERGRLSPVDE
ncbi:hypothetical protein FRC08_018527 [Ceratobasidium sp. 394]|nr:hypothetical protein FRC08_018527 [Ceratobasidium sp. 394]